MKLTTESTVVNDKKIYNDIETAQTSADDARTIADNTNQYFWFTSTGADTGAHISEQKQIDFIANPSGGNLLARSNGIALRDGLTELATFSADQLRIGRTDANRAMINSGSLEMYNSSNQLYFQVSADGMTYGTNIVANTDDVDDAEAEAKKYATNYIYQSSDGIRIARGSPETESQRVELTSAEVALYDDFGNKRIKINSSDGVILGRSDQVHSVITDGGLDIKENSATLAHYGSYARIGKQASQHINIDSNGLTVFTGAETDAYNVAQFGNTARIGKVDSNRITVGSDGLAVWYSSTGKSAHIGRDNVNTGSGTATGDYFTFGSRIGTYGRGSFATGESVTASAPNSFATGWNTIAGGAEQMVAGRWNVSDTSSLFIIGKGTSESARSNALKVDGSGNLTIAGKLTTGYDDVTSSAVKQTVDNVTPTVHAYRFGKYIWMNYKLSNVQINQATTIAVLSLNSAIRPKYETIIPASITNSNYQAIGTGIIRFETGGWVYLVTPKTLSQTSNLYVMFTAVYIL